MSKNYYEILELPRSASHENIAQAYKPSFNLKLVIDSED